MQKNLCLNILLIWFRVTLGEEKQEEKETTIIPAEIDAAVDSKFGTDLVTQLRNDANLDLSVDEEYEDLRAELLAYHTTLAKLSDDTESARRSMVTTACWHLGGICVNYKLCSGFRYLTEVPGCKDHHNVCCFTWNKYKVKDMRDHGIPGPYPWSTQHKYYGGDKIDDASEWSEEVTERNKKKKKKQLKHGEKDAQIENVDELNEVIGSKQSLKFQPKIKPKPLYNKNDDDALIDEDFVARQIKKKKTKLDSIETLALILKSIN